jgi:RND family efflux transporter MFP subunit
LADAKLLLEQEEARAGQALRDWGKLGRGEPSGLVLRKPQIVSAKARITAAEAAVEKAARDLDRTKLRAPYHCRVAATYTDLGSYVMAGARLADLYSAGAFEVRVPVTLEELAYLDQENIIGAKVLARVDLAGAQRRWHGTVVRSEDLVDRETMTVYLVVRIEPDDDAGQYRLPPSGLFVEAEIQGRKMEQVIRIPRSALQSDNTLLIVNAGNKLGITPVKLARTMHKSVLVAGGLKDGTKVIISPMETPVPGMQLAIEEEKPADPKPAEQ